MKKFFAAFSVLLVLAAVLPAAGLAQEDPNGYFEELEGYVDLYNANLESIPGVVKRLFANERINFYISLADGEEIIGVVTSGGCEILEFKEGEVENPTLLAYVDGEKIAEALASPSQEKALEVVNSIRIEGVGFMKKVKVAFLNLVRTVAGWFL